MKGLAEAKTLESSNNLTKMVKGLIISVIINLVLLFIFAVLLTYTNLKENTIGPVIIAITGVSILARKFNDNMFYKKKWNIKWWNNWTHIYTLYILFF